MCGFAGVIVWDEKYRVMPETLRRMSAAVAHRGPDGDAMRLTREHEPITPDSPQVAMAFRRLAILDPDERSMQPFTDGRRWLVFNGEIYNFRELRAELSSLMPEYQWRTTGDTEVLLAAYAAWGEECVDHLNGMFAFAVWDETEKVLFLARDRMGQKPLYYTLGKECVAFASEISALKPVTNWSDCSEIDDESLVDYLHLGYAGGDRTIYSGVRNLLPSTWVIYGKRWYQHQYFHRIRRIDAPVPNAAESVRELVDRAVERQLVSDVPVGVFLSGGTDSSIMAACARRAGPLQTFSIGFDDARYDETDFAKRVSAHLGTDHHVFHVTPDAILDLPKLASVLGEPFADSSILPTHYLAKETRQFVKVAISGDGGDELFGGYDRYRAVQVSERISRAPAGVIAVAQVIGSASPEGHPKSLRARLSRLAKGLRLSSAQRYQSFVELFDFSLIDALRGRPWATEQWAEDHETLACEYDSMAEHYGLDAVLAARATDLLGYLPHDLLTKVDRASMLHGLEVRSPFMDHELVQFAAGLTTDQLLKGGPKRMLREAFADDLPAWVFKRKKMGFAVPIGEWFRGPLRAMLRDTLFSSHAFGRSHFDMAVVQRLVDEHESFRVDHSQRLYALLMLELWWNSVR